MELMEIIVLVCGIAFVFLSFFIGNDKASSQYHELSDTDLVSDAKIFEIKKSLENSIEETADELLEETKNKLAFASNETIISIDDFSKQTLERITHNHEEVVFMYNMLQKKEEELKKNIDEIQKTVAELETKKEGLQKELQAMSIPSEYSMPVESGMPVGSGIELARKKTVARSGRTMASPSQASQKKPARGVLKASTKQGDLLHTDQSDEMNPEHVFSTNEADEDNKTGKILALYQQRKTVLEISKALGLGQGEVKLVIDLYGKQ